jgi:hypothetical protein
MRCPFCRSASTRWDVSGDHLTCIDCDAHVRIQREPPTAYDEYVDAPSAGRLDRWIERADDALNADHAWTLAEISRLDAYRVRVLGAAGKATRCRVTLTILAQFSRWIWNIARMRSGQADMLVRAHRGRETAFSGYRHAAAEALSPRPLLGLGAGLRLGGAQAKHGLRGGMQFGRIVCSPDVNRSRAARGEDELVDRIDLACAVGAARLSYTDQRLLELVDQGAVRSRARRTKRGITLAVEPLSVQDALSRLREERDKHAWQRDKLGIDDGLPDLSDLPGTPREARKRIQRARDRVRDALRERGMIPERERQPARAAPEPVPAAPRLPGRASEALRA